VVGAFLAVLEAAFFGAAGGGVDATGALAATGAAGAGVAATGVGAAATTGSGVVGAAEAAGPVASVSISKKSAPTSTVSPSAEKYCLMTPFSGDVISTVTLSVSILAIISSA